jgi:hypothetical protein
MPRIFGFEFTWNRKSSKPGSTSPYPTGNVLSPVPPQDLDGAINIQYGSGGGYFGYYLDLDGTIVDDFQLINRYREMQIVAEVDEAVDQIVNEIVIQDAGRLPVTLNLDYVDETSLDEQSKIRVQAEFDNLLKMMKFHKNAYAIIRQWYIDGRLYYHCLVDETNPQEGIQELRVVDPRTIRKVREVTRKRQMETQMDLVEVQREYYVYNPMGFVAPSGVSGTTGSTSSMLQYNGIKITLDAVAFCPSGLFDANKRTVLSWLHKAIKPLNLLRMMEDSCVIYRVARAPERRVFYIDVGNLPKQKAEQYLYDIMQKYRNKLVYDVATGDIRDDRKFMSIMEDFWLPRREGGKGTEITTLPAGQNLSEMEDVDYFRRKLYRSLGLPPSRIDQGTGFNLGRASEISRDELRFGKFIHRLQIQFNTMFDQLLEKQMRLKGIMTEQEWYKVKDSIRYDWQQDSYFEELKAQEMWTSRLNMINQLDPYLNKYFSTRWVVRNILKFNEEEWASIREEFEDAAGLVAGGGDEEGGSPFPTDKFGKSGKENLQNPTFAGDEDEDADALLNSTNDENDETEMNPDLTPNPDEDEEDELDKKLRKLSPEEEKAKEENPELDDQGFKKVKKPVRPIVEPEEQEPVTEFDKEKKAPPFGKKKQSFPK